MAGRMPVLGQDDVDEALHQAIDQRRDRVAVGDRQRAAGHEVVLHVDDQQRVPLVDGECLGHGVSRLGANDLGDPSALE